MNQDQPKTPWWKYGHVWLVIAGPAVVVVAALATGWLAARDPDAVLAQDHSRKPVAINKASASDRALMPALQGRNHAAMPPPAGR